MNETLKIPKGFIEVHYLRTCDGDDDRCLINVSHIPRIDVNHKTGKANIVIIEDNVFTVLRVKESYEEVLYLIREAQR